MTQVVNISSGLKNPPQSLPEPLNGQDLAENFDSFQYFTEENNGFENVNGSICISKF